MNASVDVDAESIAAMRLFDRFLDADEAERAQLLAHLAASEPDVHRRLLELIAADAAAERDRFLDVDALHDAATNAISEPPRDLAVALFSTHRVTRGSPAPRACPKWANSKIRVEECRADAG